MDIKLCIIAIGLTSCVIASAQVTKPKVEPKAKIKPAPELKWLDPAEEREKKRVKEVADLKADLASAWTTLVVAHRLGTVKKCDKIAVVDDGGIQELGDHATLLAKKGLYFELWSKQGGDS